MNAFGNLGVELSPSELRETAYEILVGSCRNSGSGRPLTYISNSKKPLPTGSLQRTVTTSFLATSKVKNALGLKPKKKNDNKDSDESANQPRVESVSRSGTAVWELMRIQMRISEQTDSRVRRGLLRVAASQDS